MRLLAPAGPARPIRLRAGDCDVVSVPGRFSVSYLLLGPAQSVLVDAGSIADAGTIDAAVAALGRPLAHIVPTHLHFDHVLAVDAVAARHGALLTLGRSAHDKIAEHRRDPRPSAHQTAVFLRTWAWQGLPLPTREDLQRFARCHVQANCCRFDTARGAVLDDGDAVPCCDGWRVLATPGHSDDSICLYHRAGGVLIAGDTVRNFAGGEWNEIYVDRARYQRTIRRLRRLPIQAILPGHGPPLVAKRAVDTLAALR
ncbi:MAG: MBL fold metallo-hydrolase [Deltaproteobacteria bacterium]|nr:MBL fold metallo-hydrolase [Deltaproteobacteria bacterium]